MIYIKIIKIKKNILKIFFFFLANAQGRLPFDDPKLRNLLQIIKKGEYEMPPTLNPVIQDLISKMLQFSEYDRISVEDALNHIWFKDIIESSRNDDE